MAIETAALMLGTDKSRGYCLEMICADFLSGASMDSNSPLQVLAWPATGGLSHRGQPKSLMKKVHRKSPRLRLDSESYHQLRRARCWSVTAGGVRLAVACSTCKCTTSNSGAIRVATSNRTLTQCAECQARLHRKSRRTRPS